MARDGSLLESEYCKHLAKPDGHRECRGGRCPKWKAGAWSQVSTASPYDCFGPGDASVLARAPGPGSASSEGSAGLGGKTVPGHVPVVEPGQVASGLGTLIHP